MTRRQPPERESLILSAPSPAAAAEGAGVSRSRASQVRLAAGITTPTGRPRRVGSVRHLRDLGARVVKDGASRGMTPEQYLDAAAKAVKEER